MTKRHYIQAQHLTVDLPKGVDWHQMQEAMRQLLQGPILAEMEAILDQHTDPQQVIEIERLDIDLGVISIHNWDTQFAERFLPAFQNAVRQSCSVAVKEKEMPGSPQETAAIRKDSWSKAAELLNYYLEKGSLPWWSDKESLQQLIAQMEQELQGNKDGRLLSNGSLNGLLLRNPLAGLRLLNLFPVAIQKRLLERWVEESLTEVKAIITAFAQAISGANTQPPFREVIAELWSGQHALTSDPSYRKLFVELLLLRNKADVKRATEKLLARFRPQQKLLLQSYFEAAAPKEKSQNNINVPKWLTAILLDANDPILLSEDNTSFGAVAQVSLVKQPSSTSAEEGQYIDNAGLVLLHPYLPAFFKALGLVKGKQFVNLQKRHQALYALQWLAKGSSEVDEYELALNKLLVCWPDDQVPHPLPALESTIQSEGEKLLQAVNQHWKPMRKSSVDALREGFLQRPGRLLRRENGWELTVERNTLDILLDKLPWGLGVVKYPWMPAPLFVNWT